MKMRTFAVVWAMASVATAEIVTEDIEGGLALVVTGSAFTDDEQKALNSNTVQELWKTGSSTLVAGDISAFTGVIRVKGGTYEVSSQAGLGTTAGATHVEDGATLDYTMNNNQPAEPLYLTGNGVDGSIGALRFSDKTAKKSPGVSGKLTLTGDARITAAAQWHLVASEFDMGGFTLTMSDDTHQCVFKPKKVVNPGNIVNLNKTLWINNGTRMDHGPEHCITLTNDTNISLYEYTNSESVINWKLRWAAKSSGNGFYVSRGKNETTYQPSHWYGPVEILDGFDMKIRFEYGASHEFLGPIYGKGGIYTDAGKGVSHVRFFGTNTYEGVTKCNAAAMWFMHRRALPTTDPSKYAGSCPIVLPLRPDDAAEDETVGWTGQDLQDVYDGVAAKGLRDILLQPRIEEGKTLTVTNDFDASSAAASVVRRFTGGGTVKLTGDFRGRPGVTLATTGDGTQLLLKGDPSDASRLNEYGGFTFSDGLFRAEDVTWFTSVDGDLPKFDFFLSGSSPDTRLTLGSGVVMKQTLNRSTEKFYIAYNDAGTYGTLELLDGCVFTNCIEAAGNVDQNAAVYMRGGTVYLTNGGGNDGFIGKAGYGFFEKAGGRLDLRGWTRLGRTETGVGLFYGKGDWQMETSTLAVGCGGTGVIYQTSGQLSVPGSGNGSLSICNANYASNSGGHGVVTVCGPEASVYVKNDVFFMADISNTRSIVNLLNQGTFFGVCLRKVGATPVADKPFELVNALAYVNFNGGVFKTVKAGADIFGTDDQRVDRVTVFAGGATIDTDGKDVSSSAAFAAPTGLGVTSVSLPDDFDQSGYIGAPLVTISGDGEGATAVAEFDSTTRRVTGITVTSPGWGYTAAKTVATLSRGGKPASACVVCPLTLGADSGTGGLTKRGAGKLTLAAANNYTGPTVLEAGTLVVGAAGALPEGTTIVPKGGTLESTAANFPSAVKVDVSSLDPEGSAISFVTFTDAVPASLPKVTVVGSDDPNWRVRVAGKSLKVGCSRGTLIFLR